MGWKHDHYKGKYQPISEYTYGNGNIINRTDFNEYESHGKGHGYGYGYYKWRNKEYYSQDILGSTMLLTDEKSNTKEQYTYDAFGNAYEGDFLRVNDYGYNGKRLDSAVNLYNYGFRYMSPMLGRFTTVDPITDGNNWYVYCNNDPVNFIDRLGLDTLIINMPGNEGTSDENYLEKIENIYNSFKGDADVVPSYISGVVTVKNAEELTNLLNNLPKNTTDIIFAGTHGDKRSAYMGDEKGINFITPKDIKDVTLDDVKVYIWTCYQGKYEKEWASAFGFSDAKNVHGFKDAVWETPALLELFDVYGGGMSVAKAHNTLKIMDAGLNALEKGYKNIGNWLVKTANKRIEKALEKMEKINAGGKKNTDDNKNKCK